jgi:hypothetical protein
MCWVCRARLDGAEAPTTISLPVERRPEPVEGCMLRYARLRRATQHGVETKQSAWSQYGLSALLDRRSPKPLSLSLSSNLQ